MAVYVVTGKLGAGKTLVAVGKIKDKLNQGCKVATNLDLNLDKLIGEKAKATRCYRIPDKPVLADLESIGTGTDSYDENKNGLLVLDECGTWFNAVAWIVSPSPLLARSTHFLLVPKCPCPRCIWAL